MVIVDEKCMHPPPPPYVQTGSAHVNPPPFPNHQFRETPTLSALPSHILLQIVHTTLPQSSGVDEGRLERQRKVLYWLAVGLRLVNRAFYIACMHVLRSTYLPAYDSLIRKPYSSDPFPLLTPSSPSLSSYTPSSTSPPSIQTVQRETAVLDLFIALKVREDVWMDDSELHLEREESFKDLFDLNQPRSRLEDLVRVYGVREGVVSVASASSQGGAANVIVSSAPAPPPSPMPSTGLFRLTSRFNKPPPAPPARSKQPAVNPLPFSALSISFSTRRVGLVLASSERKRTIVDVSRTRDEKLEVAAKKLVKELRVWLAG